MKKIWKKNIRNVEDIRVTGFSDVALNYLASKGLDTVEKINHFLNFKDDDFRHWTSYKDVDAFMETLFEALRNHSEITVYADYDCDGVCAATIWVRALKRLRGHVNFFVNNRFTEGYGLNVKGMDKLLKQYPNTKLVLTCDNGVVAMEGVQYALDKGIKVIVSDHHVASPDGKLPNCPVVCEHRVDENKDICEDICGAEMSRRLVVGAFSLLNLEKRDKAFLDSLMTFSAVATIADSVKFTAANHFLVKKGLLLIQKSPYPCWSTLRDLLALKTIDETSVGFNIAPTINAISRLIGDVTKPIEMFLSDDKEECYRIAQELIEYNNNRKATSADNDEMAITEYEKLRSEDAFIILSDHLTLMDNDEVKKIYYDEGICGLVATHMVEKYNKPCATLTPVQEDPNLYKGSVRSIDGFNVKEALDKCSDLLEKYGGHTGAAGITVHKDNIQKLRERLSELVIESGVLDKPVYVLVDYVTTPDEINNNNKIAKELNSLAPFGVGFEAPNICVYGKFDSVLFMPKLDEVKKHVSFMLNSDRNKLKVVWWRSYDSWIEMMKNPEEDRLAVIGKVELTSYKGKFYTQLTVSDNKIKFYNDSTIQ